MLDNPLKLFRKFNFRKVEDLCLGGNLAAISTITLVSKLIYLDEVVQKRYKIMIHTNKYQSKTSKKDKE